MGLKMITFPYLQGPLEKPERMRLKNNNVNNNSRAPQDSSSITHAVFEKQQGLTGNGIGPAADIYEKAPTGGAVLLRSAPKHSISVAAKLL